jgi:methionyl-tRNA formyltransferase
MAVRIAMITSDQQRHRWIAARLAEAGNLVFVATESKPVKNPARSDHPHPEIAAYFEKRQERESYWFSDAPENLTGISESVLRLVWGEANGSQVLNQLIEKKPDIVFLFGSSIIREPILSRFEGRIINMHLGLSPYYRGSATNFWPLVDGVPECVGVTIHHATLQVDGGNILLQGRPDIEVKDSSHDIGCKTIILGSTLLQKIALHTGKMPDGVRQRQGGKLCRRDDFNLAALQCMKDQFAQGMIASYLGNKIERDNAYSIIERFPLNEGEL